MAAFETHMGLPVPAKAHLGILPGAERVAFEGAEDGVSAWSVYGTGDDPLYTATLHYRPGRGQVWELFSGSGHRLREAGSITDLVG